MIFMIENILRWPGPHLSKKCVQKPALKYTVFFTTLHEIMDMYRELCIKRIVDIDKY